MNEISIDLHIHSCHSPCGSLEMGPVALINKLKEHHIEIAAITDHNSIRNTFAYIETGNKNGICIFPGMEIQTEEEIHITVIFPDNQKANEWQNYIDSIMPQIKLNPDIFGDEPIVNGCEDIVEMHDFLLNVSVNQSYNKIERKVYDEQLIFFPSHIYSPSYSITSQLGFIPTNSLFTIAEAALKEEYKSWKNKITYMLIANSDAHYLNQIGKKYTKITSFDLIQQFNVWKNSILNNIKNTITTDKSLEEKKIIYKQLHYLFTEKKQSVITPVFL